MQQRTVPPAGIGLLAGLLTTAGAVGLSATGLLPIWATTPLLFLVGGLAAGLAAPVRPTIGALLGAVTGVFAAILLTVVLSVQWNPDPERFFSPFPFALIAVASVIMFTPVYAVAGAVGAAVRPRLLASRPESMDRARGLTLERRLWAGVAVGALCIVIGSRAWVLTGQSDPAPLILVFSFAGGFAAGILSAGGARAGVGSGLLAGVFGLGLMALYGIWQASRATGDGVPEGLWPIAIAIMAFWVLPAVALGGALGGSFRRPSGPSGASPEPDL